MPRLHWNLGGGGDMGGWLLVVVMFFGFNHKHCNAVVIDVVDDAVMGSDVARIGHVIATDKCFRMTQACAGMLHDVHQNLCRLLEKARVLLLPLA